MKHRSAKPRLNREWHEAHRMPKNPSLEERIEWHFAHANACACRPIPANVMQAAKGRRA